MKYIGEILASNAYPGRGIAVGTTPSGKTAFAYFIMGRSVNSRNRVFVKSADGITIYPFDETKVKDPSLIIYSPVRRFSDKLIVTNGDQTDTIYEGFEKGISFADSLKTRTFEPDAPNFTPRISAVLDFTGGKFSYEMSILKSIDPTGSACCRYTFEYPSVPGTGHFLHTYQGDGNPLPSFFGEPERVAMQDGIDEFADMLWRSLDRDNKISLYVRYIAIKDGTEQSRLINKNIGEN